MQHTEDCGWHQAEGDRTSTLRANLTAVCLGSCLSLLRFRCRRRRRRSCRTTLSSPETCWREPTWPAKTGPGRWLGPLCTRACRFVRDQAYRSRIYAFLDPATLCSNMAYSTNRRGVCVCVNGCALLCASNCPPRPTPIRRVSLVEKRSHGYRS